MINFENLMKEKGYKLTRPRQIIWRVLTENTGEHLSTREIWEIAKKEDDTIGIATVYRTIQVLDELGAIESLDKKNEFNKYEIISSAEGCIYPHLICLNCGRVIGVPEDLVISDLVLKIRNNYNFEIEDIRIKCYGFCQDCIACHQST